MRRPLHLATFLFACAAIAPACLPSLSRSDWTKPRSGNSMTPSAR